MLRAMLYYLVSYRRDRSVNIIKIYPSMSTYEYDGDDDDDWLSGVGWLPGVNIDAMDRY